MYVFPILSDLTHVAGWDPYTLHELARASWVGSVQCRSRTTSHNGRWETRWSIYRSSLQVKQNTCEVLVPVWFDYCCRWPSPGTTHASLRTSYNDNLHRPFPTTDVQQLRVIMAEATSGRDLARGCHENILQGVVTRKIDTWTVDKSCLSFAVVNSITTVCIAIPMPGMMLTLHANQ